jgi:hypothetical protein
MQKGKRYLVERNGVQFAGTYDGDMVISDTNGTRHYNLNFTVIRELTGLEAMKVGDVIVDKYDQEAKILAITNNHTAFLRSEIDEFDSVGNWYTFTEAESWGWYLKNQQETELTKEQIANKFNIPVDQLRIKE